MQGETSPEQYSTSGLIPVPVKWHVKFVNVIDHLKLDVVFLDGTQGTVIIDPSWCTGVFSDLLDPEVFKTATVDQGAVTWPNGLDLAPDAMYEKILEHGSYLLKD